MFIVFDLLNSMEDYKPKKPSDLWKSSVLKRLEYTLVDPLFWKFFPSSLLIAWVHCFRRDLSVEKIK